jgi:hypothetical protein
MPRRFFTRARHIQAHDSRPEGRNNFHELKSEATLILSPIRCLLLANKNGRVIDDRLRDGTYTTLHHGIVDVPRHIKAETGRIQTVLLRWYSHVMNVDIY